MTTHLRFEDVQVVDQVHGTTSEYTETTYVLSIDGRHYRYCTFGDDTFSGAQWEDSNGRQISGPDVEIEFSDDVEEFDREQWVVKLIEEFDAAHDALHQQLVVPAERALRARLYPWTADRRLA